MVIPIIIAAFSVILLDSTISMVNAEAYVSPIVPTNGNINGYGGSDCLIPAGYFPQPYVLTRNPVTSSAHYGLNGYGSQYGGLPPHSGSSTEYGANYGSRGALGGVYGLTGNYGSSTRYGLGYGSNGYNGGGRLGGIGGQFPPSYGYLNKYGGYSQSGYEGPYGGVNDYTQVGIAYPPPNGLPVMGGSAGGDFLSSSASGNTNGVSSACRDRSPDCAMLTATGQCASSVTTRLLCPISCGTGCTGFGLLDSGIGVSTPQHPTLLDETSLKGNGSYDSTLQNLYGFNPSATSTPNQKPPYNGMSSPSPSLNYNNMNGAYDGNPYGGIPLRMTNSVGYGGGGYGNPYGANPSEGDIYDRAYKNPVNVFNPQLQQSGNINDHEMLNYESTFGLVSPSSLSQAGSNLPSFLQYPTEQDGVSPPFSLEYEPLPEPITQAQLPLLCQDSHVFGCQNWAIHGYCESVPSYMLVYCRASCGVCRDPIFSNYYGSYNALSEPQLPPFLVADDQPLDTSRLRNATPPTNDLSPFQRDNSNIMNNNALLTRLLRNQQQLSAQETRGLLSALSEGSNGGLQRPIAGRFGAVGATLPYSLKSQSLEKHHELKQKPSATKDATASILRDVNATPLSTNAAAATAAHDALSSSFSGVLRMDDLGKAARK